MDQRRPHRDVPYVPGPTGCHQVGRQGRSEGARELCTLAAVGGEMVLFGVFVMIFLRVFLGLLISTDTWCALRPFALLA